jgi:hypothetical protein
MAALASLPAVARLWRGASQTALRPAWYWLAASYSAPAVAEAAARMSLVAGWEGHARYLAATLGLAPVVAVFGARRPHERAWQFVVLTFLVLLALPSMQAAVLRGGAVPLLHAAHRGLLLLVAAAGWVNYLFTRHWLAATLWLVAQGMWLGPWIAPIRFVHPEAHAACGQALFAAALYLAAYGRHSPPAAAHDAVWLEFRDAFGLVWAMRLLERFNAQARSSGWPWRLTWRGFCPSQDAACNELPPAAQAMLAGALRRFLSPAAIATYVGRA